MQHRGHRQGGAHHVLRVSRVRGPICLRRRRNSTMHHSPEGGLETWRRTDGSAFENQGACGPYGTQGAHSGRSRRRRPMASRRPRRPSLDQPIRAPSAGAGGPTPGVTVYDQDFFVSPLSQEVSVAIGGGKDPPSSRGSRPIRARADPRLRAFALRLLDSTDTAFAGTRTDHVERRRRPPPRFFERNDRHQQDTHTEFFVDELHHTTVTSSSFYTSDGSVG